MERSKKILVFGAAAVIALLAVTFFMAGNFTSTTNAAGGGPEMTLTVKDGGTCDGGKCTVDPGAAFTLSVEIITAPADYVLAQSFIEFGPDLTYTPSDANLDEYSWTECGAGALAVRDQLTDTSVLHGCVTGLLPPLPVSNYVGNMLNLAMTCSAGTSSTLVELLPEGDPVALTNGALFKLGDDTQVVPKVSNLTINCGAGEPEDTPTPAGPTDTPTETPTPGPVTDTPVPPTDTPVPPTNTPSPQLCGDVNASNDVTSVDAALILQFTAGLIPSLDRLVKPEMADVNSDGNVDSRDAALVLQRGADLIEQSVLNC